MTNFLIYCILFFVFYRKFVIPYVAYVASMPSRSISYVAIFLIFIILILSFLTWKCYKHLNTIICKKFKMFIFLDSIFSFDCIFIPFTMYMMLLLRICCFFFFFVYYNYYNALNSLKAYRLIYIYKNVINRLFNA